MTKSGIEKFSSHGIKTINMWRKEVANHKIEKHWDTADNPPVDKWKPEYGWLPINVQSY